MTATNFLAAVDEAFTSRADLVVELSMPDVGARAQIMAATLVFRSVGSWQGDFSLSDWTTRVEGNRHERP